MDIVGRLKATRNGAGDIPFVNQEAITEIEALRAENHQLRSSVSVRTELPAVNPYSPRVNGDEAFRGFCTYVAYLRNLLRAGLITKVGSVTWDGDEVAVKVEMRHAPERIVWNIEL